MSEEPQPQETTLADYLRVIRLRRVFIVVVAVFCAAAALAVSALQTPSYEATASLSVRDLNQDLTLLGGGYVSGRTPLQQASAHAPQVTRQEVAKRVRSDLKVNDALDALRGAIEVGVDPNSNLVTITAHSRRAEDAAAIANAFAKADVELSTRDARRGFAEAARKLNRKLRTLRPARDATTRAIYIDQLSRLQSLSSVAIPVEHSDAARVPSAPSSPKPVRDTLAALIFGLLLGVALAYARDALDRRLRTAGDVEREFDHPLVGHVRGQALGHAGAGTDESIKGLGRLEPADEESFRILRQNVKYLAIDEDLKTILVTSAMAQEGKSTVAACLAMAHAAAGKRTLLIECDLRRPVLAGRFGLAPTPGMSDYLIGHAQPHEILQTVTATRAENGGRAAHLVCIAAGTPPPRPADLLSSERFRSFLAEVSEVYDTVIVDSAPLLTVADTLEIVPHMSGVLVCVRLHQTTRDQARGARAALDRLPERPTGIVLTDVKNAGEGYYGYYTYYDQPEKTPAGV